MFCGHLALIGPERPSVPRLGIHFCVGWHDGHLLLAVVITREVLRVDLYGEHYSLSLILPITQDDDGTPNRYLPPAPSHLEHAHISSTPAATEEHPQIDKTARQCTLSRRL